MSEPVAVERPEAFRRVRDALAKSGHPHAPRWLAVAARTSQEAAEALGVQVGQIAKSVIFRRTSDDSAVLVVTSGDQRVDEGKVSALVGPLARADARFVKLKTGFSIGGVAPVAHAAPPLMLIDDELFRFNEIWAAAGHPNGVFKLSPDELVALTGAPVADVVQRSDSLSPRERAGVRAGDGVSSPCINVCRMNDRTGYCEGCLRTIDEICVWSSLADDDKRRIIDAIAERRLP